MKENDLAPLTQKLSETKDFIFQQRQSKKIFSDHFQTFFSKKQKMQEKKNELEKKKKILKDLENYNQQIDISLHKSLKNFENYTRRQNYQSTDYDKLIKETNENVTLSQADINSLYLNSLTSISSQNFEVSLEKPTNWLCCLQTETLMFVMVVVFSIFFVYKITLTPYNSF